MIQKLMEWGVVVVMVSLVPMSFWLFDNAAFVVVVPLFVFAWKTQEKTNHPLRAALKLFMLETAIALGVWCSVLLDNIAFLQ